ncbi:MAG: SDR family NAD(P)-dependent oxidoreductase [Candidatus Entotheonellia bacterium]
MTREETIMAELDPRAAGAKRLRDKVCVVTGAGQGIGRATARRLGEEGGKIVVAERVDESATRTTAELRGHGVDAMKVLADVSTFAGAKSLMDEALNAYGRIDVLVNNLGGTIWIQPYHKYTEEQVNLELERTLYPTLWCCLAVLPIMMEQRSGSIVNLGSQSPRGLYRLLYAVGKGGGDQKRPSFHRFILTLAPMPSTGMVARAGMTQAVRCRELLTIAAEEGASWRRQFWRPQ